jgi:hypothetical protein
MNRKYPMPAFAALILIVCTLPVAAGPERSVSIDAQFGIADTGIIVDIPVGPVELSPGLNYPAGLALMGQVLGVYEHLPFINEPGPVFTLDVTYPFDIGERFTLKTGTSVWIMTDYLFTSMMGTAGFVIRPEYLFSGSNWGLFYNLRLPVVHYGYPSLSGNFFNEFDPMLPVVMGFLTSAFGVLYRF